MIISADYMKEIVSWKFYGKGLDAIDRRHRKCEKAFAFHPQAFKQVDSPSDIRAQTNIHGPIRDIPVSVASWYALNIGSSLGQSMVIFAVIVLTMSLTSSDSHNRALALKSLSRFH
jgi:hypothetical protein